jgi:pyrroloquinoline quinone biosynthesis protein D
MRTDAADTATGTALPSSRCPKLSPHTQLTFDRVRGRHVLLAPESVTVLNTTAAAVLQLCQGRRTVAEIVRVLRGRYDHVIVDEVLDFLARLVARGYLELAGD